MSIGVRVAGLNINHTPNPMNKTSSLDTTLREKLSGKIMSAVDFSMYVAHANSWDVDQREKHAREVETKLLDVILAEFHQLMNEKREAIEGKRKPRITDEMISNIPFGAQVQEQYVGYNQALDDVLSILKD